MKTKILLLFCTVFLFLLSISPIFAQDIQEREDPDQLERYTLGDQTLTLKSAMVIPLFFMSPDFSFTTTNLSIGGSFGLGWNSYLNNNIQLGAEVEALFSFSPNWRALFMVPVMARITNIFYFYPFEVPIYLSAGVCFTKLTDYFHIDPVIKPGAAFLWNLNTEWALGGSLEYYFIPQIYFAESLASQTRFGNFLDITFSAVYHF
ncbi:MAG: TP0733 family outer membrane beta-barrel protein [Spirochaetia bacterium]